MEEREHMSLQCFVWQKRRDPNGFRSLLSISEDTFLHLDNAGVVISESLSAFLFAMKERKRSGCKIMPVFAISFPSPFSLRISRYLLGQLRFPCQQWSSSLRQKAQVLLNKEMSASLFSLIPSARAVGTAAERSGQILLSKARLHHPEEIRWSRRMKEYLSLTHDTGSVMIGIVIINFYPNNW